MENPIIMILYFFESLCIITLGGVLFNYSSQKHLKSYVRISLYSSLFLYLLRSTLVANELPIILHMPFSIFFIFLCLNKLVKIDKIHSILISFLGYVVVLLNESVTLYFYMKLLNVSPEQIITNAYIHLGIGILNDLTFVVIIGLIYLVRSFKSNKKGVIDDFK